MRGVKLGHLGRARRHKTTVSKLLCASWQRSRVHMTLETMAPVSDTPIIVLSAVSGT